MRAYHQIYDNDHYNRYYPMVSDPNTLPSGYGAIPYSHGFTRNKLTPKPWGIRLPATYSRLANAGGYFNEEADSDLYKYASTGIGVYFNDGISDNTNYQVGSPFNYGPVSVSYDVTISGVKNPTYPGNSGCNLCSYFNGDYRVFLDTITPLGFNSNTEGIFNGSLIWQNSTYCKPDSFPRGTFCVPRGNWQTPPYVPTLLLGEMTPNPTGGTINYGQPDSIHIAHNVLSFALQPSIAPFLGSVFNPVVTPFVFALDFGELYYPFNPASGYRRKPHMLDDQGWHLPPVTGDIWKFAYNRDAVNFYGGEVINGYLTTHKNFSCDYSEATCYVRPRKYTRPYDPREALLATANRFDVGMNKSIRNWQELEQLSDGAGLYPFYHFSGITPNSYDLYMKVDNISSGEPFCDTCNNYYYKKRTLVKNLGEKISFLDATRLDGYQADAYSGAIGNRYINDSGYFLESYNWQGISSSPFKDLNVANNPFNFSNTIFINNLDSRSKVLLPNILGICEFGCDEDNLSPSFNSSSTSDGSITGYLNNFCNNAIQLDVVTKYNAIQSGTPPAVGLTPFVYYSGWTDAYLYFGKIQPNGNNNSAVGTAYPYRLKKRLCDDRTGIPKKCNQFSYSTFTNDSGIGLLDPSVPISGGWTYERWTDYQYEPHDVARAIMDVSGLCNMALADAYLMPNYHRNTSQCVGTLPCAICSDFRIPTTLTLKIDGDGHSDVLILKKTQKPSFDVGSDGTSLLGFPPGQNQYANVIDYCEWTYEQTAPNETLSATVRGIYYQDVNDFLGPDNPQLQYSISMSSGLSNVFHSNTWSCCGNLTNQCTNYCTNVWGAFGNIPVAAKARFNPNIDCDLSISTNAVFGLGCCTDNCFDPFDIPVCTGRNVNTTLTFTFGDFLNGTDYL